MAIIHVNVSHGAAPPYASAAYTSSVHDVPHRDHGESGGGGEGESGGGPDGCGDSVIKKQLLFVAPYSGYSAHFSSL